jgi:hypothetical protein
VCVCVCVGQGKPGHFFFFVFVFWTHLYLRGVFFIHSRFVTSEIACAKARKKSFCRRHKSRVPHNHCHNNDWLLEQNQPHTLSVGLSVCRSVTHPQQTNKHAHKRAKTNTQTRTPSTHAITLAHPHGEEAARRVYQARGKVRLCHQQLPRLAKNE